MGVTQLLKSHISFGWTPKFFVSLPKEGISEGQIEQDEITTAVSTANCATEN